MKPSFNRASLGLVMLLLATTVAPAQRRDDEAFQVALGLLKRGLHEEASLQLRTFLSEQPGHAKAREAWYRLGSCYEELDQLDAAADALQRALRGKGELALLAECRYRLGMVLKAQGNHEPAAAVLAELLQGLEQSHYLRAPARYAEGECQRDLGQTEVALAAFVDTVGIDGDGKLGYAMPAQYQAGFALLKLQRFGEASVVFGRAADQFPQHEAAIECRWLEGDAAFRAKDLNRAERAFERVLPAGGAFADDACMGLAWCRLEAGNEAVALERFREVYQQYADSPHAPKARLEAGRVLHRQAQHAAAVEELAPLLAESVDAGIRVAALEITGLSLLDQGQGAPAVKRLAAAVQLTTEPTVRARCQYGLGEAHAALEQWDAALAAHEAAVREAGDAGLRGDALYGQCLALHKLGRFDDAGDRARELLQTLPEHRLVAHGRFALAESLFATKRYAEAEAAYADVPDGELAVKAAFKRAWSTFLSGQHSIAAQRFAALAKDPQLAFAEEALSMQALAHLQATELDPALAVADQYRARYPEGAFLARTERVASRVLRERGDLPAAASRLAAAAKAERAPDQAAQDLVEQAELAFQQGDFKAASALYEPLIDRQDRAGGQAKFGLAWCAFELGDSEQCLQRLEAALQHEAIRDRRPEMLELQLAALHRLKRWTDAAALARAFLAEFAGHARAPEVTFGLGVALARAEQPKDAGVVFEGLARGAKLERPERLYYEWAWAARAAGDESVALTAFAKVAELGADQDHTGEAKLHLAHAELERKENAAGRRLLAEVEGGYRAQAQYRLGFSWLEDNEAARALPCFEEVIGLGEDQPLYPEALFMAGEALQRLERHEQAAQRYAAMLAKAADHPRSQAARLHGAISLVLTAKPQDAIGWLDECLARGGMAVVEQAQAHLWLGKAYLARGDHERAEQSLQQVTALSEGELAAEAQFRIGETRKAKGDVAGAADAFVKVSILYVHEPWVQKGLLETGMCYEELQQPAKATKFFKELIERFPNAVQAEEARQRLERLGGI